MKPYVRLSLIVIILAAVGCGGEEPPAVRFTRNTNALAEFDVFIDPDAGIVSLSEVRRLDGVGSRQQAISQIGENQSVAESVDFVIECDGVPSASCPAPFKPPTAVRTGCIDVNSFEQDITVRSFFPNGLRLGHMQVVSVSGIENPTFDYRPCNSDVPSLNVDVDGAPLQQGLGLFRYGNLSADPDGRTAQGPVTASDTVRVRWRNPGGRFRATLRFFADVCAPGECSPGNVETRFWQTDSGAVNALLEGEGVVYVGGNFRYVGPRTGAAARITDASVDNVADAAVDWPAVEGGDVFAIQPDGVGGTFIGGSFLTVGGLSRPRLAHIFADGSVDPSFPVVDNNTVRALAVTTDGARLVIGGDFTSVEGTARAALAAIDLGTGALDGTWVADANATVSAIVALGSDVFVGGSFTTVDGINAGRIARIEATSGITSAAFSGAVTISNGAVLALSALPSTNTVYVGGSFTGQSVNGTVTRTRLLAVTGNVLLPWAPVVGSNNVNAIAANSRAVYVGGIFTVPQTRLVAFDPVTGARQVGFAATANNAVDCLALAQDGTLFVGGRFTAPRARLFAADGVTGSVLSWSASIGPNGGADSPLALAHDGTELYVGGRFRSVGGRVRAGLAAIDLATGAATDWAPSLGTGSALSLARAADGDVVVGGSFTTVDAQPRANLARVTEAGSLDGGWNPGSDGSVLALTTATDGTIYAGGNFSTLGGLPRARLGAISDGGVVDPTWVLSANGAVNAIKMMRGEVYIGGAFTTLGVSNHLRLAAVSPVGSASPGVVRRSFNVGATINTLDAGRDFVVFGGGFAAVEGVARSRLAAVSRFSLLPFNPGPNGTVLGVAAAGNAIHTVGSFTTLNGPVARAGIVNVFHPTHIGVDEGMTAGGSASLVAGGLHFVGGSFANASSQGALRSGLFVYSAD